MRKGVKEIYQKMCMKRPDFLLRIVWVGACHSVVINPGFIYTIIVINNQKLFSYAHYKIACPRYSIYNYHKNEKHFFSAGFILVKYGNTQTINRKFRSLVYSSSKLHGEPQTHSNGVNRTHLNCKKLSSSFLQILHGNPHLHSGIFTPLAL